MPGAPDVLKRLLLGRALRSDKLGDTLLPKRIALPVFASDALSSVAYAPDEIFLTLAIAGVTAYAFSWKIALVVALVMTTVIVSYRQNVHAYPSGGGDYEVATTNLGGPAGLTVASALLVDYTLTVAVSISSAAQYAASAVPGLVGHEALVACIAVVFLMTMNLRGVRESGTAFALPTYVFMVAILGMCAFGLLRAALGDLPPAESAALEIEAHSGYEEGVTGLAGAFLLLRAFSSGCAALTGVEAISNGVPAFTRPKSRNAATTLALLGVIAITMILGVITLANLTDIRFAEDPASDLLRDGVPVGDDYAQDPVIGQLARAVFDGFSPGFYLVAAATGIILVLAANTAFNGFPVLGSILARDGYLPRQLHTRGDRLAYSNGIVALAGFAIILIIAYDAKVTSLIQLYIVGVFISFTMSQLGMVKHWTRLLPGVTDPAERGRMLRSRAINGFGLFLTGSVLVIVLLTKFTRGAYIALIAMAVLYVLMRGIRKHYDRVRVELEPDETNPPLPSRNHAIVLVSKIHAPTLRALAYAKATRPHDLTALTVAVDQDEADELQRQWDARRLDVPLTIVASPYREVTRPVLEHVRDYRLKSPRDVVSVFIPEYVVGRWWEQLLHNQSALRLKTRLLFQPGVMVTSVPYQLQSSDRRKDDDEDLTPADAKRSISAARAAE